VIQRVFLKMVLFSMTMLSAPALASGWQDFDPEKFAAAKKENKTIVLDFYADWCPTCKRQAPILESLIQEDKYKDYVAFKVDYDKSQALREELKIPRQSTIIVFKGKKEKGRNIAGTDKETLDSLFAKGL